MKKKIANIIKYNKYVYYIYSHVLNLCLFIFRLFVKHNDKLILFNSFAGRNYDDSPRAIFEQMKKDSRFKSYTFVWAFHEPHKFKVYGARKIATDGLLYFKTALAARVWITNSSVERGLDFKGKKTLYFNTWHGTPLKHLGKDVVESSKSFSLKKKKNQSHMDVIMSQGKYDTRVLSKSFGIPQNRFLEVGLPRNDILSCYSENQRKLIKRKLGIAKDKKVILYCPTFREFDKDKSLGVVMAPPVDLKKWEDMLSEEYVLLIRAHYEVSKIMEIHENSFVKNMTGYDVLNDLFIISDILISDYSSVYFDFSITGKPMLHFTYDYETYSVERGTYFDIRKYLNGADNEDELLSIIDKIDYKKESERSVKFRNSFVNYYGNAASQAIDYIAQRIIDEK